MNRSRRRISKALLLSVVLSALLMSMAPLVDALGYEDSLAAHLLSWLGSPPGAITALLVGRTHGGMMAVVAVASSVVFYAILIWTVLLFIDKHGRPGPKGPGGIDAARQTQG